MGNISYEDYMRKVLGYTPANCMENTYEVNDYYVMPTNCNCNNTMSFQNANPLEKMYPEIYNKIYPLVCKECRLNTMPLTQECIERMTDNVCRTIELDLKVETNTKVEVRKEENRGGKQNEVRETRQSNNALRDLIKILILRELLGGGNRPPFPPRPPMPGPGPGMPPPPPRPPFPRPGGRPPFQREI